MKLSSEKHKSKPQWDTTSHLSEWLTLTTQATTGVGEDEEREDLLCIVGGNAAGAATLENSMEVPQKTKTRTTHDPAIALLGIYPRDTGVLFWRDTYIPMFIAALSTIAKVWKEPKCPSMDEWIKKMWYTYIVEYYLAIKKNEILPFATTWMELEGIMLSEISQWEKDKNHITSLIWGLYETKQMNTRETKII